MPKQGVYGKPFHVVDAATGAFYEKANGSPARYAYKRSAITFMNQLTEQKPDLKSRVKLHIDDTDTAATTAWRERERRRLKESKAVPSFLNEPFYLNSPYVDLHFPHFAIHAAGKIAYTASDADGICNRQIATRIGRYLERFFPELPEDKKREIEARFVEQASNAEVLFAYTREEIRNVYANGPSSCMSGGPERFHSTVHPVEFYAAGDFAVAYTKNQRGKINSRVICLPSKKVFINRSYGATGPLLKTLKLMGYSGAKPSDLVGVKVRLISPTKSLSVEGAKAGRYSADSAVFFSLYESDGPEVLNTKIVKEFCAYDEEVLQKCASRKPEMAHYYERNVETVVEYRKNGAGPEKPYRWRVFTLIPHRDAEIGEMNWRVKPLKMDDDGSLVCEILN